MAKTPNDPKSLTEVSEANATIRKAVAGPAPTLPPFTKDEIDLEASRILIDKLDEELEKAHTRAAELAAELYAAKIALEEAQSVLNEKTEQADESYEEATRLRGYNLNLMEACKNLRERVGRLEGFLTMCKDYFYKNGHTSWAEEAARILGEETA